MLFFLVNVLEDCWKGMKAIVIVHLFDNEEATDEIGVALDDDDDVDGDGDDDDGSDNGGPSRLPEDVVGNSSAES